MSDKKGAATDQKVLRLFATLVAKDKERLDIAFRTRQGLDYESVQSRIAELYQSREVCDRELSWWLERRDVDTASLESGACLNEAQAGALPL